MEWTTSVMAPGTPSPTRHESTTHVLQKLDRSLTIISNDLLMQICMKCFKYSTLQEHDGAAENPHTTCLHDPCGMCCTASQSETTLLPAKKCRCLVLHTEPSGQEILLQSQLRMQQQTLCISDSMALRPKGADTAKLR